MMQFQRFVEPDSDWEVFVLLEFRRNDLFIT